VRRNHIAIFGKSSAHVVFPQLESRRQLGSSSGKDAEMTKDEILATALREAGILSLSVQDSFIQSCC
jgi:hypothetical protein